MWCLVLVLGCVRISGSGEGIYQVFLEAAFLVSLVPFWTSVLSSWEDAMRPVALGRKNWIHIGSEEAGPRVAAIVSIVETCRRLNIPVREYLGSVLPGLANFPINRIAELTPVAWAARI
jgi:hypothetical protein